MFQFAVMPVTLNLVLGTGLGAAGGLLGIGGGLIAIPVLAWLYGMDQHLAQGTALVMIVPNVLIGFIRYRQRNDIDLRTTGLTAAIASVTTWVSAQLASALDAAALRTGFALFLLALAAYFSFQLRTGDSQKQTSAIEARWLPALGVLSGAMSGVFSVGGGLVVVPALVTCFRMTQTQAQGIALALALPGSLVALYSYAQQGHVSWQVGLPLALAGVVSVPLGVVVAHWIDQRCLRILFCAVLVATALATLARS